LELQIQTSLPKAPGFFYGWLFSLHVKPEMKKPGIPRSGKELCIWAAELSGP
jgi:hypothetical protein